MHNEAMMELGAIVCRRRKPLCLICPVHNHCEAIAIGDPESYPRLKRKAQKRRTVKRIWMLHEGKLLLHRRPATAKRLPSICELPEADGLARILPESALVAVKKRGIANENIEERIYDLKTTPARISIIEANSELLWHPIDDIDTLTLSGPHKKWIAEIANSTE